jgi:putative transposase
VDYIHYNPVKHGYTKGPADWQYSSIHRYIAAGLLDADWATAPMDDARGWGE